jgi:hypothetical protein
MSFRFLAAVLAIYQIVIAPSPLLAGERSPLLTPSEKRAYHDCLYASFIDDYCRFHAWGTSEAAFRECVIANAAGRIPFGFSYWSFGTYDACRAVVQRSRF